MTDAAAAYRATTSAVVLIKDSLLDIFNALCLDALGLCLVLERQGKGT
jgi:hypothetical protein